MAKSPAFVLSEATGLELDDSTLSIRHGGDVVIEQSLGRDLGTVQAGGDLTIRLPRITGTLEATGTVRLIGTIDAVSIKGARIILGDQDVKCRAISATEQIRIGAASLKVDAILAPRIELDPNASGRVTVIQSNNERSATKIKGGFSLADYEDMFGDSASFLADRGLAAPDENASPPSMPEEEELVQLTPTAEPADDDGEEVDDPLSLSLDDLEPLAEVKDPNDSVRKNLQDALDRILGCYEGNDLPPAVSELRELIHDGDLEALAANITAVWNGLLGFHQKRGIRPHHQVTHAFNVIHSLVS